MRIKDILTIKEFEPVVDLAWGLNINEHEKMLSKYIMTDDIAETFVEILESFNMVRSKSRIEKLSGDINSTVKRAHILSGQYGTGKSYFLLMLSIILEMRNSVLANKMIEQFKNYPELQFQLRVIQDKKKYFVVRINGEAENQKEFIDVIQSKILESLEREFKELRINSVYSSVKKSILKAYENPLFRDSIDEYLEERDEELADLIASISNFRREGLEKAKNIIREVTGFPLQIEVPNFDSFLTEVNEELRRNGYDELVIIFDEFSAYIHASIENRRINKDLGQIQTLCQLTSRNSQKNIGFVVSLHKDINDILQSYGVGNSNELEKIMGRFQAHTLKFEQGNELIKNTLNLDKSTFRSYAIKHREFIERLENKYPFKFEDFYPIHPATLDYLMPISEIYAQKTRTTLGFIKEIVKEKYFAKPVEENGKLNLVTLSDLFENFQDSIANKKPEIINIYNQSINGYSSDDDIIKYLRAITIAYSSSVTQTNAKSELTASDIMDIYQEKNEDVVRESMSRIVNANYSNVIVNKGAYRLIAGTGGVKIEKKISEQMSNISASAVMKNILEKSESRIFIKKNYELKYNMGLLPFDVNLDGAKLNLAELTQKRLENLVAHHGYGKVIFVIPDFYEVYDKDKLVREYSEKFRTVNSNVCIAFVNENPFREEELREYGALLRIEANDKEIIANEDVAKVIITRRRKLEDKIRNKYLRKFSNLRNFTFVFGGGKVENSIRAERVFYEELIFGYYNKFPREIKVENFNTRAGLNEIINLSIERGVGEFSKNATSSGVKQLKMLLKPLDLIKFTETVQGYKFQLKVPGEEASVSSREIMDIILNENMPLKNKYQILQDAPYGLSDKLVDLYLYVASKTGKISVVLATGEKEKFISLDDKTLKAVSSNPGDYKVMINKEFIIPVEVEEVWNALSSLKIVKQSKARDFKAGSSNDFNPFSALGGEIKTIYENLEDKERRLRAKGIKTKELKKLVDKLKEITGIFKPEEFFNKVIELPNIMNKNKEFKDNIVEFKNLLIKLRGITGPIVSNYENATMCLPQLEDKIVDLNGYGDLKAKVKELEELMVKYQQDFYNVEIVGEIDSKLKELIVNYNNEYKLRHDTYNNEFVKYKDEFLNEMSIKLEAIKILKNLNFKNISSLDEFTSKLINYFSCDLVINDGSIATCKICDKRDLKKLEGKKEEIRDLFIKHKKIVNGIFESYLELLKEDVLKDEMLDNSDYKKLIFALTRISDETMNGNEILEIKDAVESIENEVNTILNNKTAVAKNVDFNEITDELLLELQGTGQKYLSLDEVKNRFETIIEKYKSKAIMSTKI